MTAAQVRQTQADVAKAKAVAEAARKKAQEAARQKAAAAELQKAAAAAQQAAAEAQKPQAPAEQTPRRFVPEAPQNPPAPVAPAAPDPGSVYYANCAAVRAAGAAPIHIGQPGYSPKLDRDGDGVGCE
ncbi:excalibur calcium-binding domain-containing protein [Arthrobacter woluwensis]|uniref:excalibur calcium-binding domain-containing protein n=1 Tax=Arthrobacter woluwensis TaxID=156980 RepID=UPI0027D925B8|nr:excalibur calcium-binding domain-containing protein [Arthrobacter woluwensis]